LENKPLSQLRYFRIGEDRFDSGSSNEDDHGDYIHTKRKSELLSSLYGLPYGLIDNHHAN
jgi:hypothetical protein